MKKRRVVLVGCGGISHAWLKAVAQRQDVAIAGLVDLNQAAAEKMAVEYKLDCLVGTNLTAMLKKIEPEIAFDCTVPEAHYSVTTTALRHGCHVLGEKPMADTMANARKMVVAAKKYNRIYAVMQNRRYLAPIIAARKFLASGALGRITTVHCDFFIGAHFGGFREQMEHVLLVDMAIHTFDQARYLIQADAKCVLAHDWNPPGSWYKDGASAVALFEMTDDIVYCYRGSWCSEGPATTWESSWRIIGEKGSMLWDGGQNFQVQVVVGKTGFSRKLKDVKVPCLPTNDFKVGHAGCIDEFLRCLKSGKTPQTVCTDNIKSMAMVHSAIAAAEAGRSIICK